MVSEALLVPRVYQLELLERAKVRNTIVLLRTGAGKTLIGVELIKHYLLSESPAGNEAHHREDAPPQRIIFLCPTKILASQQAEVIASSGGSQQGERLLVLLLTGETRDAGGNVLDQWTDASWAEFLLQRDWRVLVSTPEPVCRALSKGLLRMQDLALLVVDECHHCCTAHRTRESNSPMALIFREHYHAAPRLQRPRVLGLTASAVLGKARAKEEVARLMQNLQVVMDSTIVTVHGSANEELDAVVPKPRQELLHYDEEEPSEGTTAGLRLVQRSLRRAAAASQLSSLRAATPHHTADVASRLILQRVVGAASSSSTLPSALRCTHVRELCQQVQALVRDLGPLCALLALNTCFRANSQMSDLLGDGGIGGLSVEEHSLGGSAPAARSQPVKKVEVQQLMEAALRLERQTEFPLEELRDEALCSALCLTDLVEGVLQLLPPMGSLGGAAAAKESLHWAKKSRCPVAARPFLLKACEAVARPLGTEDVITAALLHPGGARAGLVTDKVRQLAAAVLRADESSPGQSMICFVEMRVTAAALVALLVRSPPHRRLWPRPLVGGAAADARSTSKAPGGGPGGASSAASSSLSSSSGRGGLLLRHLVHDSASVLEDFRSGACRLLVATEVAEEGLDIPTCLTVFSFDPPNRPKAFIQQRGRARAAGGKMVVLVPRQDPAWGLMMTKFAEDEECMTRAAEDLCGDGASDEEEEDEEEDGGGAFQGSQDVLFVEATGASLSAVGAVQVLERFCQTCAPQDTFHSWGGPLYWRESRREPFQVFLGAWAPVRRACGRVLSPVRAAKGSAALAAVRALHAAGALDDHLSPAGTYSCSVSWQVDPDKALTDAQWIDRKLLQGEDPAAAAAAAGRQQMERHNRNTGGVMGRNDRGAHSIDCDVVSVPKLLRAPPPGPSSCTVLWRHSLRAELGQDLRELLDSASPMDLGLQVLKSMLASLSMSDLLLPGLLPPSARRLRLGLLGRYGFDVVLCCTGQEELPDADLASAQSYHRRIFGGDPAWPSKEPLGGSAAPPEAWTCGGTRPFYVVAPSRKLERLQGGAPELEEEGHEVEQEDAVLSGCSCVMVQTTYFGANRRPIRSVVSRGCFATGPDGSPVTSRSLIKNRRQGPAQMSIAEYLKKRYGAEVTRPEEQLLVAVRAESMYHLGPICLEPPATGPDRAEACGGDTWDQDVEEELPGFKNTEVYLAEEMLEEADPAALPAWHASHLLPYVLWALEQLLVAHDLSGRLEEIRGSAALVSAPEQQQQQAEDGEEEQEEGKEEPGRDEKQMPSVPDAAALLPAITAEAACRSFNLERLEVLGDSFLKLEVSCQVFESFPLWSERNLHEMRIRLVNNRLLALRCARLGLGRYLRCLPFRIGKQQGRRLLWAAPGGAPGGGEGEAAPWEREMEEVEAAEEPGMVRLPLKLKALGDVVEALLGAFWCHGGASAAREALALLGIAVPAADSSGRPWKQSTEEEEKDAAAAAAAGAGAAMPLGKEEEEDRGQEDGEEGEEEELLSTLLRGLVGCSSASEEPRIMQKDAVAEEEALGSVKEALEAKEQPEKQTSPEGTAPEFVLGTLALGHADEVRMRRASAAMAFEFRSPGLVREALTHCSMLLEPSYQRLEFLGDAVLEFVVTCALYALPEGLDPGAMTSRRSAVVCNDALARRCVELDLHSCIRHLSGPLVQNISDTVRQVDKLRQQEGAGHLSSSCSGGGFAPEGHTINKPLSKCCADVLESLIGAMFVESSSSAEGGSGGGAVLPEHRQLEAHPSPSALVSAAPSYRMLDARDVGIETAAKVLLGGVICVDSPANKYVD